MFHIFDIRQIVKRNLVDIGRQVSDIVNVNTVNKDFTNCINMLCNSLCDVVHKRFKVFTKINY